MRHAIYVPNRGTYGSVAVLTDLAVRAEAAGWDGLFIWDTLLGDGTPVADPQVTLAAVAAFTSRITFGPMVTPLARRRPWKVAREIASLAQLSDGRFVFGCSVGTSYDTRPFPGEVLNARQRAAKFTDTAELLRLFLSGQPVEWTQSSHSAEVLGTAPGRVSSPGFLPVPDRPVPFWGGASVMRRGEQREAPFSRAARILDGLFPVGHPWDDDSPISLEEFQRAVELTFRGAAPTAGFDLVACGRALGQARTSASPERFAAEGATWWLEVLGNDLGLDDARAIVGQGPPKP